MNTSRKGILKELRTQELLEADGWTVASRRHIGGAGDVLAVKPGERTRLIEVKATADGPYKTFGPGDRVALLEAAKRAGAVGMLAWWKPRARTHQLLDEVDWP